MDLLRHGADQLARLSRQPGARAIPAKARRSDYAVPPIIRATGNGCGFERLAASRFAEPGNSNGWASMRQRKYCASRNMSGLHRHANAAENNEITITHENRHPIHAPIQESLPDPLVFSSFGHSRSTRMRACTAGNLRAAWTLQRTSMRNAGYAGDGFGVFRDALIRQIKIGDNLENTELDSNRVIMQHSINNRMLFRHLRQIECGSPITRGCK